ncbi:hypothetical protein AB0C14_37405 [Microbispora hainanensis]
MCRLDERAVRTGGLRGALIIIAHGDDWGAAQAVREIAAPFAHR